MENAEIEELDLTIENHFGNDVVGEVVVGREVSINVKIVMTLNGKNHLLDVYGKVYKKGDEIVDSEARIDIEELSHDE